MQKTFFIIFFLSLFNANLFLEDFSLHSSPYSSLKFESNLDIRFTPNEHIPKSLKSIIDADEFLRLSLIASSATNGEIENAIQKMRVVYEKIASRLQGEQNQAVLAERTLEYLYDELLSTYSSLQTRTDIAVKDGSYNCVSSTILYMYVAKKLGLNVTAIETPDHAFCTVFVNGKNIDVETTNPSGFNPGVKRPLSFDDARLRGYYVVPAKHYSRRKNVSDARILSLIYYNRISELQKQQKDNEAVGLAIDAAVLQNNSDESFSYIHRAVHNTAVLQMRSGNIEDAILLVEYANNTFGKSSLYSDFFYAAVNNLIAVHSRKNDFALAKEKLETYKHLLKENDYLDFLDRLTFNSIVKDAQSLPFEDAYSLINKNKSFLKNKNYTTLVSQASLIEANKLAKDSGYLEAFLFLDKMLKELPQTDSIVKNRNAYRQNFIGETHNKAVLLVRQGKKDEARKILENALSYVENSMLRNDLKRLD